MSDLLHKRMNDCNPENDDSYLKNINPNDEHSSNAENDCNPENDKLAAIRVAYEDRWDWWKWVKRQPKGILSDGTKVTLSVLFDCFNEDKDGRAWPSREYLAKESGGVTERAIYGRISQAENAQALIVENRGGGVIHHDNGVVDGITCHYYMGVPGSALPGMGDDTLKFSASYPEVERSIPGSSASDTLKSVSYNTPSDTLKEPPIETPNPRASSVSGAEDGNVDSISVDIDESPPLAPSLDTYGAIVTEYPISLNPEAPNPSDMDSARACEPGSGVQGRKAAVLPVATDEQRAALCDAWSIKWPDGGKTFRASSSSDHEMLKIMVVLDALEVLYHVRTDGIGRRMQEHVESALGKHRSELAWRRREGTLTHEAIADVLAVAGFRPLDAAPAAYQIPDDLFEEGKWL